MRSFTPEQLQRDVPMGLAWLVGSVMEAKGRQALFADREPELLTTLRRAAIIQSAESSNRIEGVTVDRDRLQPLVLGTVRPRDRSETEIVGYRQALLWIHDDHAAIEVVPDSLLALHRLAQQASGDAGEYKAHDNTILEVLPDGRRRVRFRPVSAAESPDAVEQLCLAYAHTTAEGSLPPLLATASFTLDLLSIHPFRDGNGRALRLYFEVLVVNAGFVVTWEVGGLFRLGSICGQDGQTFLAALWWGHSKILTDFPGQYVNNLGVTGYSGSTA